MRLFAAWPQFVLDLSRSLTVNSTLGDSERGIRSAKHEQRRRTKPRQQRIAEWQEAGREKFIWMRRNALKSPDSYE
jgi:hypothetical protein